MIGVITNEAQQDVVREFFELFKTPWEFFRERKRYDVLLCCGDAPGLVDADVVVAYSCKPTRSDEPIRSAGSEHGCASRVLTYRNSKIPIYGNSTTFADGRKGLLIDEASGESAIQIERFETGARCNVGYDLFAEVRTLLTTGQPAAHASAPTLELHISVLRELITGYGVALVEIPPVPEGFNFIVCLTHDVDHPSIRLHKWDHTTFGFLYRAVFGSLLSFLRGRTSVNDLIRNWAAALKLPLVQFGVARDFWRDFTKRYLEIEKGVPSTFFVIPFKGRPGKDVGRRNASLRAAKYCAADIADSIRELRTNGCEVGLHGIDAWVDVAPAREELAEIRRLTGVSDTGVRMHWLSYNQQSPLVLEQAGAKYDSTVGYNETVGYRAGTTQVFKPLGANHILELPMHVMDTALFYPAYLDLSSEKALELLGGMMEYATRFGGCFTINWHDRSIAPERLWGEPYRQLIEELKRRGAWFATATQAVAWFQRRRMAVFETENARVDSVRVRLAPQSESALPGLRVRSYGGREHQQISELNPSDALMRIESEYTTDTTATCGVS